MFIATDEPNSIVPKFREFETISAVSGSPVPALPDHVFDFEILRRADYLAICNSSFSRLAAILAPAAQKCFLPSFQKHSFEPYEPWGDPAFWPRFADSWRGTLPRGQRPGQPASAARSKQAFGSSEDPTILLDVADLLSYLRSHSTLSGIQRVEVEILRNLLDLSHPPPFRFVVMKKHGRLAAIDKDSLLQIVEDFRSGTASRAAIERAIRVLRVRADPCTVRARDVFLTLGSFWSEKGMGIALQQLKNSAYSGAFIHDILPMTTPEYFEARANRVHVKGVTEALTFADFVLTTSEYNKRSLAEYWASRKFGLLTHPPGAVGPRTFAFGRNGIDSFTCRGRLTRRGIRCSCVGTIEARKNPTYLFNIWKTMVQSGRRNIPLLVFVGRLGWLVRIL